MAASTPAKRAPRKVAPVKKAGPRVVLDLDSLTKDKAFPGLNLPKVPFTFLLDGTVYELADPRDSDWKQALNLASNPFLLMRTALVGADDPIEDPTEDEIANCRERHGLTGRAPLPGTADAEEEELVWPDGVIPAVIDRFTAAPCPGWKLNALFANWHEHYKIDLDAGKGILAAILGKTE